MAVAWVTEGIQTNPPAGTLLADTRSLLTTAAREIVSNAQITVIISASVGMEVALQWYRVLDPKNPGVITQMREQVIPTVLSLVTFALPGDLLLLGRLRLVTRQDVADGSGQGSIIVKT